MSDILITAILIAIMAISTVFMYLYLLHRSSEKFSFKVFFKFALNKKLVLICIAAFVEAVFIYFYSYYHGECNFVIAFMQSMFAIWILTVGYIDLKEKIIPNKMILLGIVFWVIIILLEIFIIDASWKEILVFSAIGAGICGGMLFVVAIIVKTALGMGDVKMFFVVGLLFGFADTYSIMLLSMMIMAILSIVLLAMKKVTRKTAIPMAPFVVAGYLLHIVLSM